MDQFNLGAQISRSVMIMQQSMRETCSGFAHVCPSVIALFLPAVLCYRTDE